MRDRQSMSSISEADEESRRLCRDEDDSSDSSENDCDDGRDFFLLYGLYDLSAQMLFQDRQSRDVEAGPNDKKKRKGRPVTGSKVWTALGYLFGLGAMLGIATSAGCAQALGGYMPEFELNAFRFLIGFLVSLPFVIGLKLEVIPDNKKTCIWLAVFCFFAFTYNIGFYGAAIYLPVATLGGIEASLIIFITTGVTLVLTRVCHLPTMVCVILCAMGAVLITQPRFLFSAIIPEDPVTTHPICFDKSRSHDTVLWKLDTDDNVSSLNFSSPNNGTNETNGTNGTNGTHGTLQDVWNENRSDDGVEIQASMKGYVLVILAAISSSSHVFILKNPLKDMNVFVLLFWQGLTGTAMSVIAMLLTEHPMFPDCAVCMLLVMGQAFGIALATPLCFASMLLIPPVMYAVMNTLTLAFLFVAQYTVLRNINGGYHNATEITGAVAIILGNLVGPAYKLFGDLVLDGDEKDKKKNVDDYDSDNESLFLMK